MVVKMTDARSLIAIVVKKGWEISQLDVYNVLFHGDLHVQVYMEAPMALFLTLQAWYAG